MLEWQLEKLMQLYKVIFEKTGATMAKEWAGRAGSRGQAVLSAYK